MNCHLSSDHKDLDVTEAVPKPKPKSQPPLTFWTKPAKEERLTLKKQKEIDDALMELLVMKSLPTSLVDNEYFRKFVALLDPG